VTYDLISHLTATGRGENLGQQPITRRDHGAYICNGLIGDVLFYDLPYYPDESGSDDGPNARDHAAMMAAYNDYHESDRHNANMYGDVVNMHTSNRKHALWNLVYRHPYSPAKHNVIATLYRIYYPSCTEYRTCP